MRNHFVPGKVIEVKIIYSFLPLFQRSVKKLLEMITAFLWKTAIGKNANTECMKWSLSTEKVMESSSVMLPILQWPNFKLNCLVLKFCFEFASRTIGTVRSIYRTTTSSWMKEIFLFLNRNNVRQCKFLSCKCIVYAIINTTMNYHSLYQGARMV